MILNILKKLLNILLLIRDVILHPKIVLFLILNLGNKWAKVVYSILTVTIIGGIVLCGSVFLYITFYLTYVPHLTHSWPIHLKFRSCESNPGLCSEPSADLSLEDDRSSGYVFGHKQNYQIFIDLEMPDSSTNQKLGMFALSLEMFSKKSCKFSMESCSKSEAKAISNRHALMDYKSPIHKSISSVIFYPFYAMGLKTDNQILTVEMFSALENDNTDTFYKARVFVRSRHIEVKKANLRWVAKFSGLRYWMYYHPFISTAIGIYIFSIFLSFIPLLSLVPLPSEFQKRKKTNSNINKKTNEKGLEIGKKDKEEIVDCEKPEIMKSTVQEEETVKESTVELESKDDKSLHGKDSEEIPSSDTWKSEASSVSSMENLSKIEEMTDESEGSNGWEVFAAQTEQKI